MEVLVPHQVLQALALLVPVVVGVVVQITTQRELPQVVVVAVLIQQ
jgi:hypothetical protein